MSPAGHTLPRAPGWEGGRTWGLGPQSGGPPKHQDVRQRRRGPGGRHAQRCWFSTVFSGMSASDPAALPLTA